MTQRSILAGLNPNVIIRSGGDVRVEGRETDRVLAETDSRWGLKIERRSESEIARIRARVGDRTLLDVRVDPLGRIKKSARGEAIEVEIGGSGKVYVPQGSNVMVYAGKSAGVHGIQGRVTAFAGRDLSVHGVQVLAHASAGGSLDLDCESLEGDHFKFEAGRDLRFFVRSLVNAKVMVNDLGGYWEATLGDGRTPIRLNAGGDVTLVTDREVMAQPPNYVLGRIERPGAAGSETTA